MVLCCCVFTWCFNGEGSGLSSLHWLTRVPRIFVLFAECSHARLPNVYCAPLFFLTLWFRSCGCDDIPLWLNLDLLIHQTVQICQSEPNFLIKNTTVFLFSPLFLHSAPLLLQIFFSKVYKKYYDLFWLLFTVFYSIYFVITLLFRTHAYFISYHLFYHH